MAAAVGGSERWCFAVFYRTAVGADPIQVSVRNVAAVEFEPAAPFRRVRSPHRQRNFVSTAGGSPTTLRRKGTQHAAILTRSPGRRRSPA